MVRSPEELSKPIKEAVNQKAVMFSHLLLAITITVHTILDPRALGYQIVIAIFISVVAMILASLRFFDLASLNAHPKWYLATYYIVILAGFIFVSDAATPYITGFFLLAIFSNLYYGSKGVNLLLIVTTVATFAKYFFLMATTPMTTTDKLNVIVTLLVFVAVCSIFMNVQKVYDWDYAKLKITLQDSDLEKKRLNTLINNMTESVLVLNHDGMINLYNAASLSLFDTNRSLTGKKAEDFVRLEDSKGKALLLSELLPASNRPVTRDDIIVFYSERDTASLSITITPLRTYYGQNEVQNGYIATIRDITREKSLEEERNEFISVISHELRTPVAVTEAGLSNAMLINTQKNGDEAIGKSLQAAHEQALYLSNMLNDLSTFARAEQNDLELSLEKINPAALIEQLRDDHLGEAKSKSLKIESELKDDTPSITSNKLYIREILQNFVTNSIKYSDKGTITITAEPHKKGIKFSVSDEGIGISTSDQKKVFDKFFRAEDFRTRSTSGTGLGLYIAKKLAKIISAEFELKSKVGKGSTFSLIVPDLHGAQPDNRKTA